MSNPVPSHRSVDVLVVDTPRAAGVALGAPRADAESTHVLCRHWDESLRDFGERVLRRIQRIQLSRRVRSLSYVVGGDGSRGDGTLPLLGAILPLLDAETHLLLVGPDSRQRDLFEGVDSALQRRPHDVTVQARLYSEGSDRGQTRAGQRPGRAAASASSSAQRPSVASASPRLGGWFPAEAARAPDSVRAYAG